MIKLYLTIESKRRHGVKRMDGTVFEPGWDSDEFFKTYELYGGHSRINKLYAILDNVNNKDGIEHIPLRGFPDDCGFLTFNHYCSVIFNDDARILVNNGVHREWAEECVAQGKSKMYHRFGHDYISDPDKFGANWCTTKELDEAFNAAFKNEDGTYCNDCERWLSLIGAIKGYELNGKYECRAVYWFTK